MQFIRSKRQYVRTNAEPIDLSTPVPDDFTPDYISRVANMMPRGMQDHICERIHINRGTLTKWKSGKQRPHWSSVELLRREVLMFYGEQFQARQNGQRYRPGK